MAAYGLYTHIQSNKIRSIVLLAGLFLLVYVIVYAGALIIEVLNYGGAPVDYYLKAGLADVIRTLPFSTGAALLWIVIAYFFHQNIIDAVAGGEDVTRQQEPRLYNLLENLCISRGIPMPKLKIVESDALNAYATGLNQRQYAITVTTGLLNALNDQEIEAVLGHELTHIRNGDVQMMVIAVVIAGVVGFFAELLFRGFFNFGGYGWGSGRRSSWSSSDSSEGSSDRKGSGGGAIFVIIIAVALIAVAWLLSQLVAGIVALARTAGRRRFGRADEKSRCDDLGAAQDRRPRRTAGRDLRRDGIMPRQSARRLFRPVRDPPLGGQPRAGAGQICRRTRPRPAGASRAPRSGRPDQRARTGPDSAAHPFGPMGFRNGAPTRQPERPTNQRSRRSLGQSRRPVGASLGFSSL
jgi:Zn-dependent protease with chaperone function